MVSNARCCSTARIYLFEARKSGVKVESAAFEHHVLDDPSCAHWPRRSWWTAPTS
jgi:hypothetical protein